MPAIKSPALRRSPAAPARAAGRWQIETFLGEGRWTQVFAARPRDLPPELPSDYALKLLHPSRATDPLALALLRREAHVGQSLSHRHLLPVLAAHAASRPYYLVMPRLEGATCRQWLDGAPVPAPRALWVVRQAAEALQKLHDSGWLHGDVKPGNLFVSRGGHVTLFDFGLARRIGRQECAAGSAVTGTLQYIAPEMLSRATHLTPHADVYSLGVMLYESLTRRLPFDQVCETELSLAHLQSPAPDPRNFAPHLSMRVCRLLRKMLAKEPLRRPATAELVAWLYDLEIDTFSDRAA